ncbi:MAG: GntR family transcriptional regulator [Propioniciclava sp.]
MYSQLEDLLLAQISGDEYSVGDLLPSEAELESRYAVSRITVRRALEELERAGWVVRRRGRGTTVVQSRFDEPLNRIRSFTDEMRSLGKEPHTSSVEVVQLPPSRAAAHALEIPEDRPVLRLDRVRSTDGQPLVHFSTFMAPEGLSSDPADYTGSLYDYLEVSHGIVITRVQEHFEAQLMPDNLAEQLQVAAQSPCMKRVRLSIDQHGNKVEYTVCHYRGDRYRYHVEMGG